MDSDEENQLNAEIEMQIQDKMEKAQECDSVSDSAGGVGEVEAGDMSEQDDITMNGGSMFSFVAPQALPTSRRKQRTSHPNKIFGKSQLSQEVNQGSLFHP